MFKYKTFRDKIDSYNGIQESSRDKLVDFLNDSDDIEIISISENLDRDQHGDFRRFVVTLYYKEVDVE